MAASGGRIGGPTLPTACPTPGASTCTALGEFSDSSPQHLGPADLDQALGGREKRYDFAPSDVTLHNVEVSHSASDGIFVSEYARHWLIEDVNVHDNGNGIYLERESQATRGLTSVIARNHNVGIAIDSSAKNLVERNVIEDNGAIGIALYKNCGEGGGVTRYQHSDSNVIVRNVIRNQKGAGSRDMTLTQAELNAEAGNKGASSLGVGIWIASRQGLSSRFMRQVYSKTPLACSDAGRDLHGQTYFPDHASNNQVTLVFRHLVSNRVASA
jgi:parallel beta-helix repeat protein